MKQAVNMPEKKFAAGALTAVIWLNHPKAGPNKEPYRTVSFQRRYKDMNGEWQSTTTLHVNDLPRACLLLQKAFEYLVMKDYEEQTAAS